MTFHRGQKVVCMDASNWHISGYGDETYPVEGGVYTIRDIEEVSGVPALLLHEVRNQRAPYKTGPHQKPFDWEQAFAARRFKPVVSSEKKQTLEAV